MIKQKKSEKRELKGPSLTIKWAFASSFFIFVVFTIFAVITYKSSINLLVAKERNNVERTISEVTSRLANSDEELTLVNTYRNLTNSRDRDGSVNDTSICLLYTSDAADEEDRGEIGGRRVIKKKRKEK